MCKGMGNVQHGRVIVVSNSAPPYTMRSYLSNIYHTSFSYKVSSNGCNRTLWKKKPVQVSDVYGNNWQLF